MHTTHDRDNLVPVTPEVEIGTHVLVQVGSGDVLRPGIIERHTTRAAYRGATKRPAVALVFSWANGRVTHGRVFGLYRNADGTYREHLAGVWLAPEPHSPATVEILTNQAVA